MSDKINIEEILAKYWPELAKRNAEGIDTDKLLIGKNYVKKAFKEALEAAIDKCSENFKLSVVDLDRENQPKESTRYLDDEYRGYEGYNEDPILVTVDKQSILNVKGMINYDN